MDFMKQIFTSFATTPWLFANWSAKIAGYLSHCCIGLDTSASSRSINPIRIKWSKVWSAMLVSGPLRPTSSLVYETNYEQYSCSSRNQDKKRLSHYNPVGDPFHVGWVESTKAMSAANRGAIFRCSGFYRYDSLKPEDRLRGKRGENLRWITR